MRTRYLRYVIYVILASIIAYGLVVLYSASYSAGIKKFGDSSFFLRRQLIWILIGTAAMLVVSRINPQFWQRTAPRLVFFSIFLLFILFISPKFSLTIKGARRWLKLGSYVFQPSEFAKFAVVIYTAYWFAKYGVPKKIREMLSLLLVVGLNAFFIMLQPDFGTGMVLVTVFFALMWIVKVPFKNILSMFLVLLVFSYIYVTSSTYRLNRIKAWLNPWEDKLGIGYHVIKLKTAIGYGGLIGVGLGREAEFVGVLPEQHSDSIFAVLACELGYVGVVILFVFYFLLILSLYRLLMASLEKKKGAVFEYVAGLGMIFIIAVHIFFNIAVNVGVLPLTGLPLPFLSYGGSATLMFFIEIGFILAISRFAEVSSRKRRRIRL